ncbi:MAG: carboxypeptidase regulatory-like domain-containing protein [Acidobacteria bacterium]|nr:carboxypeptidase regulatory-like domain-containing protein [Acidobacteriota bacterium]
MRVRRILGWVLTCGVFAAPGSVWAQQATGNISGVVRDTTGAVMPGVTVEATSPALIEKVRSTITDDQGRYQVIDLRPGTYTVTFTLSGFSAFRREGLELTSGFTATVNAELRVGTLEETVTVTGETPLVDIRNVRQQVQLSRDTLESIPGTGRLPALYQVLPAAVLNVPTAYSVGAVNERVAANYNIHGAPSASPVFDGMNSTVTNLTQGVVVYNQLTFQEVVVETGGISAERDSGGAQVNIVQRDGGNTFSGALEFFASGPSLESSNIGDALRARGASNTGALKRFYDTGGALGGPIVRNRLWFFGAVRTGVTQQFQAGNSYNRLQDQPGLAPGVLRYEPDSGRPSFTDEYARDFTLRLTWQAAEKHKIAIAASHQPNCNCLFGLLNPGVIPAPESTGQHHYNPNFMPVASWTYPMTNRILFEAGASGNIHHQTTKRIPGVTPDMIQITEQARNFKYGSRANSLAVGGSYSHNPRRLYQGRAAVSYVTGTHNFKTGFNVRVYHEGNLARVRGGVPRCGVVRAGPVDHSARDHQSRPPVQRRARLDARAGAGGRPVRARAAAGADRQRAALPQPRSAAGRRVRPVRHGTDGRQSVAGAVRRAAHQGSRQPGTRDGGECDAHVERHVLSGGRSAARQLRPRLCAGAGASRCQRGVRSVVGSDLWPAPAGDALRRRCARRVQHAEPQLAGICLAAA